MSFRVRVAGSSANLGPGFDALGMALSLHDEIEITAGEEAPGTARVAVEGEGAGRVPEDARHLIVRVIHKTLSTLDVPVAGLCLRCRNTIPQSRGLGSSAAAIVAGVAAGYELAGVSLRDNEARALDLAASFEGHADNVAASLFGGLVIAWQDDDGFHAARREPAVGLRPIALIPQQESATRTTRGLLPEKIPHIDAAFAAGRAALAVHALSGDSSLLLAATDDRLHQGYREAAWPETMHVIRQLRASGVPAVVSGAGPTVLALPPTGELPAGIEHANFGVFRLAVEHSGVRVERSGAFGK